MKIHLEVEISKIWASLICEHVFESAGVPDDPVPSVVIVPATSGVIAVLLTACVTIAFGMIYSKRKKTKFNTSNKQTTSELSPLPADDLLLQTIYER